VRQYLLSIYQPDGDPPPPEDLAAVMAEVDAWRQEVERAGRWVFHAGLGPPEASTVVRRDGAGFLTTDGPYAEGKEHIGGFALIRANDLDEALRWSRGLAAATGLPIEVRPVQN
jgi:hypothetical protein